MGWAYCGQDKWGREIGYGIEATCDRRGCGAEINRGLGCVCGGMHNGDEGGCGRYFCDAHGGGWGPGPRGGCSMRHRGKRVWGKTKCQLLSRRVETASSYDQDKRKWNITYASEMMCACHEWDDISHRSHEEAEYSLSHWRSIPGYEAHVLARGFASEMREAEDEAVAL